MQSAETDWLLILDEYSYDAWGRQPKCLAVTDEFTKEGLALDADGRIRSPRVIEVLSRLVSERRAPTFLRSDNGPEFVSRALPSRIAAQGIDTAIRFAAQVFITWIARLHSATSFFSRAFSASSCRRRRASSDGS